MNRRKLGLVIWFQRARELIPVSWGTYPVFWSLVLPSFGESHQASGFPKDLGSVSNLPNALWPENPSELSMTTGTRLQVPWMPMLAQSPQFENRARIHLDFQDKYWSNALPHNTYYPLSQTTAHTHSQSCITRNQPDYSKPKSF